MVTKEIGLHIFKLNIYVFHILSLSTWSFGYRIEKLPGGHMQAVPKI